MSLSGFHEDVLVVNTASKCGFTPQYAGLQELYEKYGDDDFMIIGFPANNFLKQEPGSNEEIATFCSINYGVTFPMRRDNWWDIYRPRQNQAMKNLSAGL